MTLTTLHDKLTNLHAFDITQLQYEMSELMRKIEATGFEFQAGSLAQNVHWQELKELVTGKDVPTVIGVTLDEIKPLPPFDGRLVLFQYQNEVWGRDLLSAYGTNKEMYCECIGSLAPHRIGIKQYFSILKETP